MEASHRGSWPLQRGFDRFTGSLAGGGSYYRPKGWIEQNKMTPTGEGFYYTVRAQNQVNESTYGSPERDLDIETSGGGCPDLFP